MRGDHTGAYTHTQASSTTTSDQAQQYVQTNHPQASRVPSRQCEVAQREIDNAQRGDTEANNKTEHKETTSGENSCGCGAA